MPTIERIEVTEFDYEIENLGFDAGDNRAYDPGCTARFTNCALRIFDSEGCVGAYVPVHAGKNRAAIGQMFGLLPVLIGKDPLEREHLYQHCRRLHRHLGGVGYSAIDICLWDYAGQRFGAPVWQLLGGYRKRIPAYASTLHGDRNGGLSSPEAFADFAAQCRDLGYKGFKIHGWCEGDPREESRTIAAVAEVVGGTMDLMVDPGVRTAHVPGRGAGRAGVRRGGVPVAGRPVPGWRLVAPCTSPAAPDHPNAPADDRTRPRIGTQGSVDHRRRDRLPAGRPRIRSRRDRKP